MTKAEQNDRAIRRYNSRVRVYECQRKYAELKLDELMIASKAQAALIALREAEYKHFQLMSEDRFGQTIKE